MFARNCGEPQLPLPLPPASLPFCLQRIPFLIKAKKEQGRGCDDLQGHGLRDITIAQGCKDHSLVNPCNRRHTPGDSSSGSAAGVRAGYFALALGTQTMGSVIRPAAFCGVTGFKPSQGLLPGQGIINFSPSLDQAGFFCATSQDAATTLSLFCDAPAGGRKASALFIVPEVAYMDEVEPGMRRAFDQYCNRLARLSGVRIKTLPVFDNWQGIRDHHQQLAAAELAQMFREWFADFGPLYRLKTREFIEFG